MPQKIQGNNKIPVINCRWYIKYQKRTHNDFVRKRIWSVAMPIARPTLELYYLAT